MLSINSKAPDIKLKTDESFFSPKDYNEAEDIASKLNDIAKAKEETNVEYWVVSTEIPSLVKKVDDDDIPF